MPSVESRRRPAADWWNAGARSHSVQFYSDDQMLVELLARFVGIALVMGDAAIVLATRKHRDAVSRRLRRRGLDVRTAQKQGRYIAADAGCLLSKIAPDGELDADAFDRLMGRHLDRAARAAGGKRYRTIVFGEMVALAWGLGLTRAAIQIEERWNLLARARAFSLCCAYPMRGFAASTHAPSFLKICAQHSHVFPAERPPV